MSLLGKKVREWASMKVHHYNHDKYWKMRGEVVKFPGESNKPFILLCWYLYQIRKMDSFNMSSMGTTFRAGGATFKTPPILSHGISGIIINDKAVIGCNCTIFQQVTIGEERGEAPSIGNECLIGAGARILGGVQVGNNVKVGANAVIVSDIPDNCTVVGIPGKIVKRSKFKYIKH